jgi:hypothetical protein
MKGCSTIYLRYIDPEKRMGTITEVSGVQPYFEDHRRKTAVRNGVRRAPDRQEGPQDKPRTGSGGTNLPEEIKRPPDLYAGRAAFPRTGMIQVGIGGGGGGQGNQDKTDAAYQDENIFPRMPAYGFFSQKVIH